MNTNDLLQNLDLDVEKLEWSAFNANPNAETASPESEIIAEESVDETKELSEIIAEAKEMIAHAAGIDVDKLNIQISF